MAVDVSKLLLLMLLGVFAGFLNIMAGGGSLLTLPFLIFLGLPPGTANGTNRIAILVQNILATFRFHRFDVIPKGVRLLTAVPAILGSLLGAWIAVEIDALLFKRILALIMVPVVSLMFFKKPEPREISGRPGTAQVVGLALAFLGVGIYGGFIQGGIGFLIMAVLTFAGYDLVKTNALKVLVILLFTPFALAIFVARGQVDYLLGA
ncbi:MAG: sulfite exporter TauE/SafE family protein, partial [Calditrichaeota bacterium]